MIFLDNSSSSFYKPPCVIGAVKNALEFLPFNPSRSAHSGGVMAGQLVYNTRKKVAAAFNCLPERVIFTGGCTEALNLAIFGAAKKGGHIIATPFEHNAVLRPLRYLSSTDNLKISFVTSPSQAEKVINPHTCMIIVNHVSNVTGAEADLNGYADIAKKYRVAFLVDAAQSAGYIPTDMRATGIDMLALAPHKGLHAMQGVGALLVNEKVKLTPFKYGGTGTLSSSTTQPDEFPEGFEAGTLPTPAIASLNAGLTWSLKSLKENAEKLRKLSGRMIGGLQAIRRARIFSRPNDCGIVAFNIDGFTSQEAGDIFNEQYDIAVRCGYHCAPLLHEYYHTKDGMIRASLGVESTADEVDFFVAAVREMAGERK